MRKIILLVFIVSNSLFVCTQETTKIPTVFSAEALNDSLLSLNDEIISFESILNQHKGKTILIDIWASWCKDCLKSLPNVIKLSTEKPEVVYLFLSLDKTPESWKKGIEKHNIKGEHYFLKSGWKGSLGSFIQLDWIPRYLVVDKNQQIKIFKEVEVTNHLKQNLP